MAAFWWLIRTVAEVPLRRAVLAIHANEDLDQEGEERVVLELLLNQSS